MLPSKERILEILESASEGICDDCLSEQSQVFPRQQANAICRSLFDARKIKRGKAICPLCHRLKISNFLITKEAAASILGAKSAVREDAAVYGAAGRLDSMRREIIGIFNEVDPIRMPRVGNPETFSARLSRLQNEGKIPSTISSIIRLLNTFRNLAVYDSCVLESSELNLLEDAWKLVKGWRGK